MVFYKKIIIKICCILSQVAHIFRIYSLTRKLLINSESDSDSELETMIGIEVLAKLEIQSGLSSELNNFSLIKSSSSKLIIKGGIESRILYNVTITILSYLRKC